MTTPNASVSRRDFIKSAAGGILSTSPLGKLLLSKGISADVATHFASSNTVFIKVAMPTFLGVDGLDGGIATTSFRSSLDDAFMRASSLVNDLMRASVSGLRHGVQVETGGWYPTENEYITAEVTPDVAARLTSNAKDLVQGTDRITIKYAGKSDDGDLYGYLSLSDDNPQPLIKNFVKVWWNAKAKDIPAPMSDKMFSILKSNGVDPTDRSEYVKREIANYIAKSKNGVSLFGDPSKYGVDRYDIEMAKKYNELPAHEQLKLDRHRYRTDDEKGINIRDLTADEMLANPMHQSYEESYIRRLEIIFS